jgi:hypothetical protein
MGEEFYAIIKLISGEEIFSLISIDENDGDPLIILQNPIIIKIVQNHQGIFIKVKPWIELSDDDFFIVRYEKIITMTETKDQKLIDIYINYVSDESNSIDSIDLYQKPDLPGEVKPSKKMGYICSVEDARKNLEKIFKDLK